MDGEERVREHKVGIEGEMKGKQEREEERKRRRGERGARRGGREGKREGKARDRIVMQVEGNGRARQCRARLKQGARKDKAGLGNEGVRWSLVWKERSNTELGENMVGQDGAGDGRVRAGREIMERRRAWLGSEKVRTGFGKQNYVAWQSVCCGVL